MDRLAGNARRIELKEESLRKKRVILKNKSAVKKGGSI
jgi:hypothetical protein